MPLQFFYFLLAALFQPLTILFLTAHNYAITIMAMKCSIGTSAISDPLKAVDEATFMFRDIKPVLILFFCPVSMFTVVTQRLFQIFPNSTSVGTTTHFSFSNGTVQENTLTITCVESGIKCSAGLIHEISRYPSKYIPEVDQCLQQFPHKSNLACLEFTTAASFSEELVLDTLNSRCEPFGIPVIGGTAVPAQPRNNTSIMTSYVALNGQTYTDTTVFLMMQNKNGRIKIFKESIYEITDSGFFVTSADVKKRLVYEFDNKPAVEALIKVFHCTRKELPEKLRFYHLGRQLGTDVQVCSFDRICDNGAIAWHTRVYNNTKMHLVKPVNYQQVTLETISTIKLELPDPSFVFLLQCEGRSQFFKSESYLDEFAKKYGKHFSITTGISVLGEQFRDKHLNYTMLAIVFE